MLQVKIGDRVHVKTHNWKNGRTAGAGEPIFGEVIGLTEINQAPGYLPYSGPHAIVYPLGGARVLSPQGKGEVQAMYILVPVADWALEVLELRWAPVWPAAAGAHMEKERRQLLGEPGDWLRRYWKTNQASLRKEVSK